MQPASDDSSEQNVGLVESVYLETLNLSPQDVFVVAEDGSALFVNDTACNRRGVSREHLLTMKVWEWNLFIKPSSWARRWSSIVEIREAEFESVHLHPKGGEMAVKIWVRFVDFAGTPAVLCFIQEIGELQHKALQADIVSKQLEVVLRNQNTSVCYWNPISNIISLDPSFNKMFEMGSVSQISFDQWESMVEPIEQLEWRTQVNGHLLGKTPSIDIVTRMLRSDGELIYVRARGETVSRDVHNYPDQILVVHEDITQRLTLQRDMDTEVQQLQARINQLEEQLLELDTHMSEPNQQVKSLDDSNINTKEFGVAMGYLRISLIDGSIEADDAWLALNEFTPGSQVNVEVLHSTIAPYDLARFKDYAFDVIKAPACNDWSEIELNLRTAKGRDFVGKIRSRKTNDGRAEYIESYVQSI